eukprot:scaffold29475_cov85-Cyclotella_meneghiniana.AAC.4
MGNIQEPDTKLETHIQLWNIIHGKIHKPRANSTLLVAATATWIHVNFSMLEMKVVKISKWPSSDSNATNKRPLHRLTHSAITDHPLALTAVVVLLWRPITRSSSLAYYKQRTPRQDKVLYAKLEARRQTVDDRAWMNRPLTSLFEVNKELFQAPPRGACEVVLLYGLKFIKEEGQEMFDSMEKCIVSYATQDSQDTIRRRVMEFGAFLHGPIRAWSMTPYSKMESLSPTEYLVKKVNNPTVLLSKR